MSKCYKCDRCGEIYADVDSAIKIKTINGKEMLAKLIRVPNGYNDLDLCDACYRQLRAWWNEGIPQIAPIEDTILGRTEDIAEPHPEEVRS